MNNNAIPMTQEAITAVNEVCSESYVDHIIVHLQDAEEALEKVAYEEMSGEKDYLYRFAYELRLIRQKFENLEKTLGYEPDRE